MRQIEAACLALPLMQVFADVFGGTRLRILAALIVCFAFLGPQSARALDCLVQSFQADYWEHERSDSTYLLVVGAVHDLKFVERIEPNASEEFDDPVEIWTAKFEGNQASSNAFDQPFATDVTISIADGSEVAGGNSVAENVEFMQGRTMLYWLEEAKDGYRISSGLCGGSYYWSSDNIKPALRCLRGGYCPKPD